MVIVCFLGRLFGDEMFATTSIYIPSQMPRKVVGLVDSTFLKPHPVRPLGFLYGQTKELEKLRVWMWTGLTVALVERPSRWSLRRQRLI